MASNEKNKDSPIKEELKLIQKLNFISKAETREEDAIEIEYHYMDIVIAFILTYSNRDKIEIKKISSTKFREDEVRKFTEQFISNFEWRDSVKLKHFYEKFNRELVGEFSQQLDNINIHRLDEYEKYFKADFVYYITILIHIVSLLIKSLTGLYGYSGEKDAPKFGDYEAQRHWMELTYNLNITDWYTPSEDNPTEYWPMDYPPLSGYHSYICGFLLNILLPKSVGLKSSWGFESPLHKLLMRNSVIISDFLFFHIPVFLLLKSVLLNKKKTLMYYISSFLLLSSPLLIIIDHGHFQYNCVMHGLFILSVYFLYNHLFILSVFFFCLCVNFKQMGLYYALPFPFYVLRVLIEVVKKKENKIIGLAYLILHVIKYAIYAALLLGLIWGPWIVENKHIDVLKRIFPIWRGVFEDKVASFWCTLNIIYKINKIPHNTMIIISSIFTIIPSFFSCLSILLYKKPSKKLANLAYFITSFSFFFFSFHVHEKTILVPFLAYLLCLTTDKFLICLLPTFSLVSLFSLYPLLKREGQQIPYFAFIIMSFVFSKYCDSIACKEDTCLDKKKNVNINLNTFEKSLVTKSVETLFKNKIIPLLEGVSVIFIIIYHIAELKLAPPANYPWLYPTINATFSFMNFFVVYLVAQLRLYYTALYCS